MKPIGGFFELEHSASADAVLPGAGAVNFGRAGLELILRRRCYGKVWLPEYICPVVFALMNRLEIPWQTYPLDSNFEPIAPHRTSAREAFLYVNYFGVKDDCCRRLEKEADNLILDLTQAFFYEPEAGIDGFNSARKFFGVPDGAFVFGEGLDAASLPESTSWNGCEALLRRLDNDLVGGYCAFQQHEKAMQEWQPAKMSRLTAALLGSIDIHESRSRRCRNFATLHARLAPHNRISLDSDNIGPLCYPFLHPEGRVLKRRLIDRQIFTPTFWPGLESWLPLSRLVEDWIDNLVCIPCDHRYSTRDMETIIKEIL
ncbi:MAG: hypothetical protein ACOX9C_00875 [Kiritimatiellia bacterium]|jgi:hypothetical protein